jgi:hypothetical protein
VDVSLPSGYQPSGWHSTTWLRDQSPRIELRLNPQNNASFYDPHKPCILPDLELPTPYGNQVACVSSDGFHVVRRVVWGSDTLRCSVLFPHGGNEGVGEAWALCAGMSVRLDAPSLAPEVPATRFLLTPTSEYEVEITLPRYFRPLTEQLTNRVFIRGSNEPNIAIRISEWAELGAPCRGWAELLWRRDEPQETMAYCRDQGLAQVRRLVPVGRDVIACEVTGKEWEHGGETAREVCRTMRVTARAGSK